MVGQHIGKYRITEQIGRGGMGTVYRAVDETLHREVAIKVLNAELSDPTVARRFRAEAVTVARLNHPGIATIYELVQHDGQWLMVMEFLRGETLEALVARKGPLAIDVAADLVMQTLAALAHAHSLGVVHRDLKPANLMMAQNGMIKVMDFGIARVAGAEQLTSAGFMMGTPAYMAPEQVLGQEIDARTDLYAVGLVLYHLATGQLPFGGKTPLEMAKARIEDQPTPVNMARPDLPAWVAQVVDLALRREPGQRFQTALRFREALARGLANLPIDTELPTVVPPELVSTAAPSSLPIVSPTPPVAAVKFTPASAATPLDTMAPSPAVVSVAPAVPAAPPATRPATPAPPPLFPAAPAVPAPAPVASAADPVVMPPRVASVAGKRINVTVMAGAAALVFATAVAGYFLLRPSPPPVVNAPAAQQAPAVAPTPDPLPPPAASTPAAPASSAKPPATPGSALPPGPVAAPPTTGAVAAVIDPAAAAGSATAARGGAAARGRTGAPADAPAVFKAVRAFVLTGRKVDEPEAALHFGDGRVRLTDPTGRRTLGSLPYAEITSVVYSRGRNPRWYPTLAAPPANVDMPGGLFRPDRHWLAFQSRGGYLITRLPDGSFRQVIATANARLSAKVEQLAQRSP